MPDCPKCGARNPRENTTCRNCGALLGVEVPAAAAAETPLSAAEEPAGTATRSAESPPPTAQAGDSAGDETEGAQVGRGALLGLGAAIVLGAIWYALETRWYLPFLGVAAGWIIAQAVRSGAGRKRARPLQWISVGLTVLTIVGTQFAILTTLRGVEPGDFLQAFWQMVQSDVVFIIFSLLALWWAYITPAPRRRPAPRPEAEPEEARAPAAEETTEAAAETGPQTSPTEEAGLTCARCQASTSREEALVLPGRRGATVAVCPKCVREIEAEFAAETEDIQVSRAAVFGLGAAVVSAVAWYLAERYSGCTLAFLSWLAGWGIAEAVRYGAGRKRGRPLQWIAVGLTLLTILAVQLAMVAPTHPINNAYAVWSRDGGRIAFVSDRSGNPEVYVANGGMTRLTDNPAVDAFPSWSPKGDELVFQSDREGGLEIYLLDIESQALTRLTENPASDQYPVWSPGGTRIAFQSDRDGNPEIYVMNADGSEPVRRTDNPAADEEPAWSPDSARMAFQSDRDGNPEIYVMSWDGSNVTRLTESPAADKAPAWSPDGEQIAFQSDRDGNWEIYIMRADGSDPRNLTNHAAQDRWPSWTDETHVAFVSDRDGNPEIYQVQEDGGGLTAPMPNDPSTPIEALGRRMQDLLTPVFFLLGLWQAYSALSPRRLPGRPQRQQ